MKHAGSLPVGLSGALCGLALLTVGAALPASSGPCDARARGEPTPAQIERAIRALEELSGGGGGARVDRGQQEPVPMRNTIERSGRARQAPIPPYEIELPPDIPPDRPAK